MPEPLCPFGDGRHQKRPWYVRVKGVAVRSGLACMRCAKTWEYVGPDMELEATWDRWRRQEALREMVGLDEEMGLYGD